MDTRHRITVGAGQKAQEWVCSSGGATGLCLWHYQFCSLLPTKLWLMKPSSFLISISLFIFIMAETESKSSGGQTKLQAPLSSVLYPSFGEREWLRADSKMIYGPRRWRACFCLPCQIYHFFHLSHISNSRLYKILHKVPKHIATSFFQRQCYRLPSPVKMATSMKCAYIDLPFWLNICLA